MPFSYIAMFCPDSSCFGRQNAQAVHIECEVAQSDLDFGAYDTDGSQQQRSGFLRLDAENMFDARSDFGAGMIAAFFPVRELTFFTSFALQMRAVAQLFKTGFTRLGTVGGIRINVAVGIGCVKQFVKHLTVMDRRTGYPVIADEFVLHINRNMIFITVMIPAVFLSPTGVNILLPTLGVAPIVGRIAGEKPRKRMNKSRSRI